MITIDKSLSVRKQELLTYFRERAGESLEEVRRTYASKQFKKQATAINKAISETRKNVEKALLQKAAKEKWKKYTGHIIPSPTLLLVI